MKKILYPIFLKCLGFIEDPFWRFVYEDMAYGRCPNGIYLHKNYLCCAMRQKEFSYKIEQEKTSEEIYQDTLQLLKHRVGILSDKEKLLQRQRVFKNRLVNRKDDWVNVKKKMIRDTLLENFVLQKSSEYNLSIGIAKKILSILMIGLMFKTINSVDIEYHDGYIHSIQGFVFYPKKVLVTRNIYLNGRAGTRTHEDETIRSLCSLWPLYLNEISIILK